MLGEQRRVAVPLGQAGDAHDDLGEAVIKVLAEACPRRSSPPDSGGWRRRSACRRRSRWRPPIRSITRSCRKRSSLTCKRQRDVADLVEEQGAAMGELDLALGGLDRAGEGALLVAEQFGLEQILGDRGAVDRDEAAAARAGWCGGRRGRAIPCRCREAPSSITETSVLATRSIVRATLVISGAAVIIEPSTVRSSPTWLSSRRFSLSMPWSWKARRTIRPSWSMSTGFW